MTAPAGDATGAVAPPPFRPPFPLRGTAAQTIGGVLLPPPAALPPSQRLELEVEPGERLLLLRSPAPGPPRGRLLLLHGLGGSADSRYLRHTLAAAHARGWEVIRVNARGAGDGLALARRLPHAGRWPDLAAVIAAGPWTPAAKATPLVAAGFSLGGATLLRLLGESGPASGLDGAVAVNPPIDLAACLEALERPGNILYHLYYVASLQAGLRARARLYPDRYRAPDPWRHRSVRAMDEDYVAPDAGFSSAADYYAGCSARPLLDRIRTPAVVISSQDDPFVPAGPLADALDGLPPLRLHLVRRGGHMGYVERRAGRLGFWAAGAILAAAEELAARTR